MNRKGFAATGILYTILLIFLSLVVMALFTFESKKQILDNLKKDVSNEVRGEISDFTPIKYDIGEPINYNPITGTTCDNPVSTTGTKTGCMRFYVIKDNKDSIDVILDHNTTATVAYETSGTYKEYSQASIKAQVDTDTMGWQGNPRIISAEELAYATNTTTFDGTSSKWFYFNGSGENKQTQASSSQGTNKYAWLFDYTDGCTNYGCNINDSSTRGYWTSSTAPGSTTHAWSVIRHGVINGYKVNNNTDFGVRPVITIPKSIELHSTYDFVYTGSENPFNVKKDGIYKLEVWGAQGGSYDSTYHGGYGGYSVGTIALNKDETLYINIGGSGSTNTGNATGGYNGGGIAYYNAGTGGSGGGATHIAFDTGLLSTLSSHATDNRILIVAGAGGGSGYHTGESTYAKGGHGGGYLGTSSTYTTSKSYKVNTVGGSQASGGTYGYAYSQQSSGLGTSSNGVFGAGGTYQTSGSNVFISGGGSGYYGGGAGYFVGGAGGSGYIGSSNLISITGLNKHMTCYNCSESDTASTKTISNTCHNSTATANCSKEGHGYAKITYLGSLNSLHTLTFDAGDGTIEQETMNVLTGNYLDLPTPTAPTNYSFAGWYTQSDGKGELINNDSIIISDLTLYAYYVETVKNFAYTGSEQTFTAPVDGTYKIELWGGAGSGTAYGAYTSGEINLSKNENLYVYVGRNINTTETLTFNAGTGSSGGWEGGGATDVRLVSGSWNAFSSLKSRIMVAAGGGSSNGGTPGAAGGLTGYSGGGTVGGTQTAAGSPQTSTLSTSYFGIANGGCSGGNGYYPGGGSWCANGSGGGSSFISGHEGCNAINYSSSTSLTAITHTGQSILTIDDVSYEFKNTKMIDGAGYKWTNTKGSYELMPNPSGGTYSQGTGHSGNGYARITYIPKVNNNPNIEPGTKYTFSYTGSEQTFTAPKTGKYKIELWGASGGDSTLAGGNGGYVAGNIVLQKNTNLYVYIGQTGDNHDQQVWNGGGNGSVNYSSKSGGGATDIRVNNGNWNSFDSQKSRIMVAGGGGGANGWSSVGAKGANAGGLTGYNGTYYNNNSSNTITIAYGGTQTAGGAGGTDVTLGTYSGTKGLFGAGGSAYYSNGGGGGGSGYYGGGGAAITNGIVGTGAGGSSFISGHEGCNAINYSSSTSLTAITHTGQSILTINDVSYEFTNTKMIDGAGYSWTNEKGSYELMPNPSGGTYSQGVGHNGNGYAKITYIGE